MLQYRKSSIVYIQYLYNTGIPESLIYTQSKKRIKKINGRNLCSCRNEIVAGADIHVHLLYMYICNCQHLVKKNCYRSETVFFNLLYYREVRIPISNKGNPSFINLDIQRRVTEKS